MKTERQLYYKLFNRITDTIATLEDELRKLRLAQIECENALLGLDEDSDEEPSEDEEDEENTPASGDTDISLYP